MSGFIRDEAAVYLAQYNEPLRSSHGLFFTIAKQACQVFSERDQLLFRLVIFKHAFLFTKYRIIFISK